MVTMMIGLNRNIMRLRFIFGNTSPLLKGNERLSNKNLFNIWNRQVVF